MIRKYRYLILRRSLQVSLMFFYFAGNAWGFTFLQGNLSSSLLLGFIPLSDPYAALQMLVAGAVLSSDLLIGVLIITLFYISIGGRAFCSWVCPINIISDASNYIRRKFGFNKIQKKQPASRNLRYFVLFLSLILSYFLGLSAFEFISPISMVNRGLVFGMGFVFVFLTLLVGMTTLMSKLVVKFEPVAVAVPKKLKPRVTKTIDSNNDELVAVISVAVHKYIC